MHSSDQDRQVAVGSNLADALKMTGQELIMRLYKLYSPALLGIICRSVDCKNAAEEILKDTFIAASSAIHDYKGSDSGLFSWLACQARSNVKRYMDKNAKVKGLVAGGFRQSDLDILDMICLQGYSHADVADKLGLSTDVVKSKLRAALMMQRR